jgi:toxin-antitoxin system PIN domain toxin
VIPLPDVNVLVALLWESHVHHATARRWFAGLARGPWATAAITQAGFVRVSSNSRVVPDAIPVRQAVATLRQLLAVGDHRLLSDLHGFADNPLVPHDRLIGHRQITDAHLVSIARQHDAKVVTFDSGLESLAPDCTEVLGV